MEPLTPRRYLSVAEHLSTEPSLWLVTGCAGFIGSHLVERLLRLGQRVRGLDDFATGSRNNLDLIEASVGPSLWQGFEMIAGDIRDNNVCRPACSGVRTVLHQAALGSVARSLENPILSNDVNVSGSLCMIAAAGHEGVERFVFASSSSVYGDIGAGIWQEDRTGRPLSPYAVGKRAVEEYARVLAKQLHMTTVGLRYFNVFGPRQRADSAYAAVIPRWVDNLLRDERSVINGDGRTSRDFCYIENVVEANLLAATADIGAASAVLNVACGAETDLNSLYGILARAVRGVVSTNPSEPEYGPFRQGDLRRSLADLQRVGKVIGYVPVVAVEEGVRRFVDSVVAAFK